MRKVISITLLLLCFLASCSKEDEAITTHELLSAHTWVSNKYMFEGEETTIFNWDCLFNQDIPEFKYSAGDSGRLEVNFELTFSKDSLYERTILVSRYLKCGDCSEYEFQEQTTDVLQAIFTAESDRLWFGSRNNRLQYFFPIEYRSKKEIVIERFFEVSNVSGNSQCTFNGFVLRSDRNYEVDFVFRPK
jgi:hypothetical protein